MGRLRLFFRRRTRMRRLPSPTICHLAWADLCTRQISKEASEASRMETGMVFINYPDVSAPDLPFGGVKRSGYGKELSNLGIEEFVNSKLIFVPNGHS